jgi:hypothetical protein
VSRDYIGRSGAPQPRPHWSMFQQSTMPRDTAAVHPLSLPGLTQQSIRFAKRLLAKKMDARVKPTHDESRTTTAGMIERAMEAILDASWRSRWSVWRRRPVVEYLRIIAVDGDSNFSHPLGQGFVRQNADERILEHRRAGQPAFKAAGAARAIASAVILGPRPAVIAAFARAGAADERNQKASDDPPSGWPQPPRGSPKPAPRALRSRQRRQNPASFPALRCEEFIAAKNPQPFSTPSKGQAGKPLPSLQAQPTHVSGQPPTS